MSEKDQRQKWGWVAYGAMSQLSAQHCVWAPSPPPPDMRMSHSRPSQLFSSWPAGLSTVLPQLAPAASATPELVQRR